MPVEQEEANESIKVLSPLLEQSFRSAKSKATKKKGKKASWRGSGFQKLVHFPEFQAGVVNLSPGWFQVAHEVSPDGCRNSPG
jgi:hypothetical protein